MKTRVFIGSASCKKRDDTHSQCDFDSRDDAIAFMLGMAHARYRQTCWCFTGEWFTNAPMIGKPIPEKYRLSATAHAQDIDADAIAAGDLHV